MADTSKGLTGTPFENPLVSTPGVEGEGGAMRGGYDFPGGQKETANMSELPPLPQQVSVPEGPAAGSTVEMGAGVTSPAIPAGNIEGGKK